MVCRPARMMSAMKDEVFQMIVRQMAAKAQLAELNQMMPSMPMRRSTSFTTPYSEWKNQAKIRPAKESGSAQGMRSDRRTGHFTLNGRFAISASAMPRSSAPGTVMRVMRIVFQVVSQNTGSSSMREEFSSPAKAAGAPDASDR